MDSIRELLTLTVISEINKYLDLSFSNEMKKEIGSGNTDAEGEL